MYVYDCPLNDAILNNIDSKTSDNLRISSLIPQEINEDLTRVQTIYISQCLFILYKCVTKTK